MVETTIVCGRIREWAGLHRLRRARAVWPGAMISTRTLLTVFDGWRGGDMATAWIEVSGPNAERLAGELRPALVTSVPPEGGVSPVEVERSADLVIATIGLVFSG